METNVEAIILELLLTSSHTLRKKLLFGAVMRVGGKVNDDVWLLQRYLDPSAVAAAVGTICSARSNGTPPGKLQYGVPITRARVGDGSCQFSVMTSLVFFKSGQGGGIACWHKEIECIRYLT